MGARCTSTASGIIVTGAKMLATGSVLTHAELYERNYSGNHEQIRVDLLNLATRRGLLDTLTAFVDQCMAEYDTRGWKNSTWVWERDAK